LNPDEAIAAGAAVQAHMIGATDKGGLSEVIMIDVVPLTLGIEMQDGKLSKLIPKNTSIPTSMTKQYTNSHEN